MIRKNIINCQIALTRDPEELEAKCIYGYRNQSFSRCV